MNKKTIYAIVAVIVVVLVVAVAGVMLLNNNGGSETTPTPTPNPSVAVADATSLQFSVTDSTGTYNYYAKNIGSETQLAIVYPNEQAGFSIVINGTAHTASSNMTGTWAEDNFQTTWDQWYPLFEGYVNDLSHWTSGNWTSADGKTTISGIMVNPTLDDSCFQVPK